SRISSRGAFRFWRSRSCAAISIPGVQKPHCRALRSWNAFCRGASSFESERPAIVSTRQAAVPRGGGHQAPAPVLPAAAQRAGAEHAVLAADVRAGEAELLAQEVD